ncbi:MAG: hypothetical protein J4F39_15855 [Candidatus Latescibacteria bacterium]|nr:hypothetical protein [Candidatus Latescibacterota bacterium]
MTRILIAVVFLLTSVCLFAQEFDQIQELVAKKRLEQLDRHLAVRKEIYDNVEVIRKYKNHLPKELIELPREELSSVVPVFFQQAAGLGVSPVAELAFAQKLQILMYPALANFESSVKAFQKDIGEDPTGNLTVWQIHHLERRAGMQTSGDLPFYPTDLYSTANEEFAMAKGTMVMHGESSAYPVNQVTITCYRKASFCEYSQVDISFPKYKAWGTPRFTMSPEAYVERYDIASWKNNVVESVPRNTGGNCRITSLSLNFTTKEFFYITKNGPGKCTFLERLASPRISQLMDGGEVAREEMKKLESQRFFMLSTDYQTSTLQILQRLSDLPEN